MQTAAHSKLPTKSEWNLHGLMPDVSAVEDAADYCDLVYFPATTLHHSTIALRDAA